MTETVELAVNGTLMRGLELNPNLLNAGGIFVEETFTEPAYRLWSIGDRHPAMVRVAEGGVAIAVEVWACRMPPVHCGWYRNLARSWVSWFCVRFTARAA